MNIYARIMQYMQPFVKPFFCAFWQISSQFSYPVAISVRHWHKKALPVLFFGREGRGKAGARPSGGAG
ncbi:MAG TPA: hypothetical protein PKJ47_01235 [Candidatus Limiplasma sp.]|nr:hypothetical protein [Candidatus Limiplasma sp.]